MVSGGSAPRAIDERLSVSARHRRQRTSIGGDELDGAPLAVARRVGGAPP
jgi:hypothetical protein